MSSLPLMTEAPLPFAGLQGKEAVLRKLMATSERLVGVRPASRLEVRPRPEMLSAGVHELDAWISGIPRGFLTELCGTASSGKTSVLLATLAGATSRGESCALIDASDSFDPSSGPAAGIDFNRLLWVRCGNAERASRKNDRRRTTDDRRPAANAESREPRPTTNHQGPRTYHVQRTTYDARGVEARLEQVLKSTDLILQSGGFGLVALDLAGIPEKFVRRIPLASWFRFQRAVEHTKTALLVISEVPCAQTCAALVLKFQREPSSALSHQPSGKPTHAELLKDMRIEAELVRSRLERKPMQSVRAHFRTQSVRAG